jgi:uncharacterized protein (TIGR02271 family)
MTGERMLNEREARDLMGATVYSSDGDKIGKVGQVYLDDETGAPEFVTVNTGLFGTNESFVPVADATSSDEGLTVPFTKDKVKDAPNVSVDDGHLDEPQERELYEYYGLAYTSSSDSGYAGQGGTGGVGTDAGGVGSDAGLAAGTGLAGAGTGRSGTDADYTTTTGTGRSDSDTEFAATGTGGSDSDTEFAGTGTGRTDSDADFAATGTRTGDAEGAVGHDTSGPTTDDAMTRSEERVDVGKTSQEAGRARLRKYVVTEEETHTVPVRKEKAVLESEPITGDNVSEATSGPDISDEEHEVVLSEERPVVEKTVEPVERVRLGTEEVTEEQQVTEEVRKERIETEGNVDERR